MADKFETKRFVLTVEGETEQINTVPNRAYNASIEAKVSRVPRSSTKV